MKFLIDTNVFFEMLFERQGVKEATELLSVTDRHEFFISDYALHSVGTYLFHHKKQSTFVKFLKDQVMDAGVGIITLGAEDLEHVAQVSEKNRLDFDDAYQYAVAEKNNLILVSFDKDFDRTPRGRKTPEEALKL